MAERRASHVATAWRGDLLVFGGEAPDDAPADGTVHWYSSQARSWSGLPCVGHAPAGLTAAAGCSVADERLYVFGGFDATRGGYSGDLHVLDLRAEPSRWRRVCGEVETHPTPRRDASLCWWPANDGGALLLFGGWNLHEVHGDLRCFQLSRAEWDSPSKAATHQPSLAAGGLQSQLPGHTRPTTADERVSEAAAAAARPLPRRGHSASVVAGRLVLFGGCLGLSAYVGDLWTWDGAAWAVESPCGTPPSARAWCSCSVLPTGAPNVGGAHHVAFVGGRDHSGCCIDPLWLLAISVPHPGGQPKTEWVAIKPPTPLPALRPRHSHTATVVGSQLLVLGGYADDDDAPLAESSLATVEMAALLATRSRP